MFQFISKYSIPPNETIRPLSNDINTMNPCFFCFFYGEERVRSKGMVGELMMRATVYEKHMTRFKEL
jgi:hypothetical protein